MRRPPRVPVADAVPQSAWRDRKVPGYWQPESGRDLESPESRVRFVDEAMRHWIATHPGDEHAARSHPHDVVRLATTDTAVVDARVVATPAENVTAGSFRPITLAPMLRTWDEIAEIRLTASSASAPGMTIRISSPP